MTTPPPYLTDLIGRAQAGDTEAFADLWRRFHPDVWRYVSYRVRDRWLVDDITSDTFLRAYTRLADFRWVAGGFGAWLNTIARHLISDHRQKASTRREVPLSSLPTALTGASVTVEGWLDDKATDPRPDLDEQVADWLDQEAASRALHTAIRTLTPDQQAVLWMRFWLDYPSADVADAMTCTVPAIKALQYRAVRALARTLPRMR